MIFLVFSAGKVYNAYAVKISLTVRYEQLDPKACLYDALRSFYDREYEDALDCINTYNVWRRRGGFEPMLGDIPGDTYRDTLMKGLIEAIT